MNDLVSVVIPTYNHAHFLKQALQSVIDQTYICWEALVVDNHSEDNTDAVVNSFGDKRIKLFKIHNRGVLAASRNMAIQHARGDWVAFLDSDDWWHPEKLARSVEVLKKGAQLVCHAEDWIQDGTVIRTVKYGPKKKATYHHLLFGKNCFSTSAVTVMRDGILQAGGFTEDPRAIGVEDYHLWLKLAKADCNMEFIEKALGCYRIYSSSQSSNLLKQLNSERWVLEDHFETLGQMNFLERLFRWRRLGCLYASTAVRWFLKGIS